MNDIKYVLYRLLRIHDRQWERCALHTAGSRNEGANTSKRTSDPQANSPSYSATPVMRTPDLGVRTTVNIATASI
jgi:hypothetical protein